MKICRNIQDFRRARAQLDGTVGYVATMGALHEGHLSLMREALNRADHLCVSIFVNPTQFEPGSDYESYPRELEADAEKCRAEGCELIFAPDPDEMYPDGHATTVQVEGMDDVLCGPQRPGHFDGVATIVTKLLNIVEPDVAVFGRKDYQQLAILRRMARDLNLPVEIVGAETVREEDGLAVSSRNRYLGEAERTRATCLAKGLARAWQRWNEGERDADALVDAAREGVLKGADPEAIDYIEAVEPDTLRRLDGRDDSTVDDGVVVAMAVHIGDARLIDNLRLDGALPEELADYVNG
jgi:pantoate--beta-alanine ligase